MKIGRIISISALILAAPSLVQAQGDAAAGQQLYQDLCSGCHAVDTHGVGPKHGAVFGRKAASQSGYVYSQALKASGLSWNDANLRLWLTDPDALVAGNKMRVKILETEQERSDVIAYLKSLKAAP
ncbi:MAG: c-type cytochrome [Panacagrimonas sp.]